METNLTTTSQAVDPVFLLIFGISLFLLLGITGAMVWFAYRYHRSRAPEPASQSGGNLWLEITWTVLPTILVLGMFYYGWSGYLTLRQVPKGALVVTATARQWSWTFTYQNGKSSPTLYVPVGRPILIDLVSEDVIHGFYLPAFRVKRDVVPGMKNHAWFMADNAGAYDLLCSQYCGLLHSSMTATVEAIPETEFAAWLKDRREEARPEKGESGAEQEVGDGEGPLAEFDCLECHSLDGSAGVGPTFKGLYLSKVTVLQGGKEVVVTADEAYLRESIRTPQTKVVAGFEATMPDYPELTDEELETLVTLIKGAR